MNILLVEDSEHFRTAIVAMLNYWSNTSCDIKCAGSLAEGKRAVEKGSFDLILLDLQLPDSHSINTLSELRRRSTNIPIVVLTGSDDAELGVAAMQAGAQDYIVKTDVNARVLQRCISYAMERSRRQALEQERIHLLEEREEFMATLTHDLKNPLIGSNRVLKLLEDELIGPQNAEQKKMLRKLAQSNTALLSMIQNIIELYRYEKDVHTLLRENTDLSELVSSYLAEISPLIEEKALHLNAQLNDSTVVQVDQLSIRRVVQNLVDNAVKFSPEGGSITVKVWPDDERINLQVTDSGPGVPQAERGHLFQRFWQGGAGKAYTPGTGLGLYLCRQIVEAHAGEICYNDQESAGASFLVRLPSQAAMCN